MLTLYCSYRVVSYNILADLYADSDFTRSVLHPYCPPYALHIDYRKQLIVKEIMGKFIVCLGVLKDSEVHGGEPLRTLYVIITKVTRL